MATGPATALAIVDDISVRGVLSSTHLLPSVRGELLARLDRMDEARVEYLRAAELTRNERERAVLLEKAGVNRVDQEILRDTPTTSPDPR